MAFDEGRLAHIIRQQLIPEYEKLYNGQILRTKNNKPLYNLSDDFFKENPELVKKFKNAVIRIKEKDNLNNTFNKNLTKPSTNSKELKKLLQNDPVVNEIKTKLEGFLKERSQSTINNLKKLEYDFKNDEKLQKLIYQSNNTLPFFLMDGKAKNIEKIYKEDQKDQIKVRFCCKSGSRNNPDERRLDDLQINGEIKDTIKKLFDNPLVEDNITYNLEHIEYKSNADIYDTILTYKSENKKYKITLNKNGKFSSSKEGRGFFGWLSGGKSRRSKKIAKKRHTRKRRN